MDALRKTEAVPSDSCSASRHLWLRIPQISSKYPFYRFSDSDAPKYTLWSYSRHVQLNVLGCEGVRLPVCALVFLENITNYILWVGCMCSSISFQEADTGSKQEEQKKRTEEISAWGKALKKAVFTLSKQDCEKFTLIRITLGAVSSCSVSKWHFFTCSSTIIGLYHKPGLSSAMAVGELHLFDNFLHNLSQTEI